MIGTLLLRRGWPQVSLMSIALAASMEAWAQEVRQPPADAQPMITTVVVKPMSQLLKEGYEITNFSAGLGGYGYLLKRDRSWILCTVDLYGTSNALKTYSRCEQLSP